MMICYLREFVIGSFVIVYLDDILIFSFSFEDHYIYLQKVYKALRANKLYAKPSMVILAIPKLEFYRHVISNSKL